MDKTYFNKLRQDKYTKKSDYKKEAELCKIQPYLSVN